MSVIDIEGFDGLQSTDLDEAGWTIAGSVTVTTSPTPRTGVNAVTISGGGASLQRSFASQEHATIITGFGLRWTGDGGTIFQARGDAGATVHTQLGVGTDGTITVYRNGTTLGASSPGLVLQNTWVFCEFKTILHDTLGRVTLKINGTTVVDLQNVDTKNGGVDGVIDTLEWLRPGFTTVYVDDVYIFNGAGTDSNNFIAGNGKIHCLTPNANGNSSVLVGSDTNSVDNYQLIDEVPASVADWVGSSTSGDKDTYGFIDLPAGGGTIAAVKVSALAAKMDAGAASCALVTRHSGTDYDSADKALTTTPAYVVDLQVVNPGTASSWTRTEVNAAEFGFKVRP